MYECELEDHLKKQVFNTHDSFQDNRVTQKVQTWKFSFQRVISSREQEGAERIF